MISKSHGNFLTFTVMLSSSSWTHSERIEIHYSLFTYHFLILNLDMQNEHLQPLTFANFCDEIVAHPIAAVTLAPVCIESGTIIAS